MDKASSSLSLSLLADSDSIFHLRITERFQKFSLDGSEKFANYFTRYTSAVHTLSAFKDADKDNKQVSGLFQQVNYLCLFTAREQYNANVCAIQTIQIVYWLSLVFINIVFFKLGLIYT